MEMIHIGAGINVEERAFAALDITNQKRVIDYFESNHLTLPEVVRKYWYGLKENE